MRYKIGDKVRIKGEISKARYACESMLKWQAKAMTIREIEDDHYKMREDIGECNDNESPGWDWYENMIEGLAEPELTQTEILKLAIETYGTDERSRMCQEEMIELSVALSKHQREPSRETLREVQEKIAGACPAIQMVKMEFCEHEIDDLILEKMEQLRANLEEEREVQVVEGKYSVDGETYTWINPDGLDVEIGGIAVAETKKGHAPIIVTHLRKDKWKNVKHHKKIVVGKGAWE